MRDFLRTLFVTSLLVASAAVGPPAYGQPAQNRAASEDLAAGRQLFAEALDDEEHHRYAEAIEKYQRVLKIRDTASIRFRMGTTFEGLGKITAAIDAYSAAIRAASKSAGDVEIARASQARIDALEPRVAHLALKPNASPTELRVDSTPVAPESMGDVRLDPGPHVVEATTPGRQPFRAQVNLSDGGRAEIPVVFEAAAPPPPTAPEAAPSSTSSSASSSSPLRTLGIVSAAFGAALMVGGVVVLGLRSQTISEIEESCPNGDCPRARERELQDKHDRAVVQGPLGGVLLGVGAATLGTGVVLLLVGREAKTAAKLVPSFTQHGVGLGLVKAF